MNVERIWDKATIEREGLIYIVEMSIVEDFPWPPTNPSKLIKVEDWTWVVIDAHSRMWKDIRSFRDRNRVFAIMRTVAPIEQWTTIAAEAAEGDE